MSFFNSKTNQELRSSIDTLQRINTELKQTVKSLTGDLQIARNALQHEKEDNASTDKTVLTTIERLESAIDAKQIEMDNLYNEINDMQSKLASIHNPPAHIESRNTRNPGRFAYEDGTNPRDIESNIYACRQFPR